MNIYAHPVEELKASIIFKGCPFCANADFRLTDEKSYYYSLGKNGGACTSIRCNMCAGEMIEFWGQGNSDRYADFIKQLARKWNRRKGSE